MTDDKLKSVLQESLTEAGWDFPSDSVYLDRLASALSRRGVVVQEKGRKIDSDPCLAKARADEDAFIVLSRDPVAYHVLNFWCEKRLELIRNGDLPNNEKERAHIQEVRKKASVFLDYSPKSYGSGPATSVVAGSPLTPLTYAEACALQPGDEVVCLDAGSFSHRLTKGKTYKTYSYFYERAINDDGGTPFILDKRDCHLFAAVPKEGKVEMTDNEIGAEIENIVHSGIPFFDITRRVRELLKLDSFTEGHLTFAGVSELVKRAEKAEAALERGRFAIESCYEDAPYRSEFHRGFSSALEVLAAAFGFTIHPAVPAQPLRVVRGDAE
jgi:hypothetical protein